MTDLFRDDPEIETVEPVQSRRPHERADRRRKRQQRAQRRRTLISFVVMVVALGLLAGAAWVFVRPLFSGESASETPTDYPGPGSGTVEVVVNSGDTGAAIGQSLVDADVVASTALFIAAYNVNPDAPSIQPGTYTLLQQIPAAAAVVALLDSGNRVNGLTIPEGWRATQIYERVAEVLGISADEVTAAAAEVTLPPQANGQIEGWLFASTYTPTPEATPVEVLQAMIDQTVAVLEANNIAPERWHDIIIIASIIEREVADDEYRATVSEVIQNRLASCNISGRLEMDSTLVYELGKPGNQLTSADLAADTPYNTYQVVGLPPTAIAAPGEASIVAAANPTAGDNCYFVTVNLDTGETKFTGDYSEFETFVQEYRDWQASQEESGE